MTKAQIEEIEYHIEKISNLLKDNTHFGTEIYIRHLFKEKCIKLTKGM